MRQQSRVVFLYAILAISLKALAEDTAPRSFLEKNMALVENAILSQQPAEAWIATGSALFEWRTHPGYCDLAMSVVDSYKMLRHEDVSERLTLLREVQTGPYCNFQCFEDGLLAFALESYADAVESFQSSTSSPVFEGNPFPHLMKAKALLLQVPDKPQAARMASERLRGADPADKANTTPQVSLQDALASYQEAISYVPDNPAILFRIRYEQATDLIERGYVDEGIEKLRESRLSENLLEQAWALGELLIVAWDLNDNEALNTCWQDLKVLLPVLSPYPNLPFETCCIKRINDLADMMRGIQKGDRPMQMKMDEASATFRFLHEDFKAVIERLKPWILEYPIHESRSWNQSLRETVLLVHLDYYSSIQSLGHFIEAESGFLGIVEAFSDLNPTSSVIEAWGWLGNSLRDQGRLIEAQAAYELALTLDVGGAQEAVKRSLPIDFLQRHVLQGIMPGDVRSSHVANYECVLNALAAIEGGINR
jgi:tetratricopeptide (TPR) repeat protein